MKIRGRSVLITGAGRGIGAAMALRFAVECPRGVVVSDLDGDAARRLATELTEQGVPAIGVRADVSEREDIDELVAVADREFGPIEIACSNAGIAAGTGLYAAPEAWADSWAVNVMGHVHLAQAVLPGMALRREGYLLITASAAGLLGLPGDAPYSVTKHAAVGLAEWLAFTYQRRGIRVSALCPYGVRTDFLMPGVTAGHPAATAVAAAAPILEPADVAETVVGGLAAERFLILPHADVAGMHAGRAADPDAWIASQASGGRAAAAAER